MKGIHADSGNSFKNKAGPLTIPDQGWEILLRLYGPLEPYFDRTWKPDDIVRVQ